jgi:translation elongation factor EF-G
MEVLEMGLQKLNRADPSVEYYITKQGEHVLSTCGEVHLEKCLKDLKDDYLEGQVEFSTGEPIIPFKETCVNKSVRDKVRKAEKEYEQIGDESSSEEEQIEEGTYLDLEESKD